MTAGPSVLFHSFSLGYWWDPVAGGSELGQRSDLGPEREAWETSLSTWGPTTASPGDCSPVGHPGDSPGACPASGLGSFLPGPGSARELPGKLSAALRDILWLPTHKQGPQPPW